MFAVLIAVLQLVDDKVPLSGGANCDVDEPRVWVEAMAYLHRQAQ